MDAQVLEQFRALREDNQVLREEVRDDITRLRTKIDEHIAALNERCARRGEELAVLATRDRDRDKRVDRRIALGVLLIGLLSLLLKFLP